MRFYLDSKFNFLKQISIVVSFKLLNLFQLCNPIFYNFQSYITCVRDIEFLAVTHTMFFLASGSSYMLQTFQKCPLPCSLSDKLWSQSLTSLGNDHLCLHCIPWSFDTFHILCLSKLDYNNLCTYIFMYCPILSVLCDRESYSTKIKSQWSKIFLYRSKTEKKMI